MALTSSVLREAFRSLHLFRVLYETEGIDIVATADGDGVSLWDLEYLADQIWRLTPRQEQAIRLYLIEGNLERQVAVAMGLKPESPISIYAADGIKRLIEMIDDGLLPRYRQHQEAV